MRKHRVCLLAASIALLLAAHCPAQGTLSSVRGAIAESHTPEPESEPHEDSHGDGCYDDDDESLLGALFGPVIVEGVCWLVGSPFAIPHAILESDPNEPRVETDFSAFPYSDGHDGYLIFNAFEMDPPRDDVWGMRLFSEYGTDFTGLNRYGNRLLIETAPRFGVDAEWNLWQEDLGATTDELWTGDVNLTYRFAESERAQFRAGLGINWLSDDFLGNKTGFNFTYGFDLFPAEPFVIETTLDVGRISDSTYLHARSTAGVVWNHVELFAGYDFRSIDDVDLSGFVSGVTVWW